MTNRLAATVVLMVATFMDLMDSTITNVALPAISATLEATPAQLEWTLAGYVIAFATLLITGVAWATYSAGAASSSSASSASPSRPGSPPSRGAVTCS